MSKIEDYNTKRKDLNDSVSWRSGLESIIECCDTYKKQYKEYYNNEAIISLDVPFLNYTNYYISTYDLLMPSRQVSAPPTIVEYFKKAILNDFDNLLNKAIHLQENDLKEAAKEALKESEDLIKAAGLDINSLEEEK